jgi:hypothetical protein
MRSHTESLAFHTKERMEFVNITAKVTAAVKTSCVKEGLCLVNAMHITASVFINDDEPGCTTITSAGWSGWRRTIRVPSATITIGRAKTKS